MLLTTSLLLLTASLGVSEAARDTNDIDLTLFDTNFAGPHAVILDLDVVEKVKRDSPAEVEVMDSNTVPLEDLEGSGGYTQQATAGSSQKLTTYSETKSEDDNDPSKEYNQSPFLMAISMIVVSEIGDKTFLISALMAMRHSRLLVFTASFASLALMTVLSGIVGHTLPSLISPRVTQFLAAGLFVVFGIKLTKEGLEMSKDLGVEEELAEVEEELAVQNRNSDLDNLEGGRSHNSAYNNQQPSYAKMLESFTEKAQDLASQVISPLWVQVFVMIFLGEWGDRSQIATIAMAAGSDYWGVILGAVVGHGLCTAAAVVGGKILASRISMRTVTLGGAFAFFVFAILYFYEAFYGPGEA